MAVSRHWWEQKVKSCIKNLAPTIATGQTYEFSTEHLPKSCERIQIIPFNSDNSRDRCKNAWLGSHGTVHLSAEKALASSASTEVESVHWAVTSDLHETLEA